MRFELSDQFIESIPLPVFGCDKDGKISYFNEEIVELWGRRPEIGKEYFCGALRRHTLGGAEIPAIDSPVAETLRTGAPCLNQELVFERPDGTRVVCQVNISPVKDAGGRVVGTMGVMLDLTERYRQRESLETKHVFLMNMSHEMRTPLTVIMGYTEILKRPNMNPAIKDAYLERIERASQQLLSLVDDILDFSKVESGRIKPRKERVSVEEVVEEIVGMFQLHAGKKGVALVSKLEAGLPTDVVTDPVRLKQVLSNLVGNAIKFTERGSVCLSVGWLESKGDGVRELKFEVEDTGIGLGPEIRDKLFRPFTQADSLQTKKYGGTGIGLYLSRRLAELLGGKLQLVESAIGCGSRFALTIPHDELALTAKKTRHEKKPGPGQAGSMAGVRVLLVEDVAESRTLFRRMLEYAGLIVDTAEDGADATAKAMENEYDLILMDIQMPVMDGLSATRYLRESGLKIPIIALTAHAMAGDAEKSHEAGCDDHVCKPVSSRTLIEAIRKQIQTKIAI
jgi:two-component system, chemotaxis family, CheB/CheR fusion protein